VWFGGKGLFRDKLYPLLPKTGVYIEPFGGGASVLMGREPSGVEVYNDLNSSLFDFFTVLSDKVLFEKFKRRVEALPRSRQFFNEYRKKFKDEENLVKRVSMWFLIARQSFGGMCGKSWGFGSGAVSTSGGMSSPNSSWLGVIEKLPEIHARLQRVQIENSPFQKIFERYDSSEALFYCDPPYCIETRKGGVYEHEMDTEQHEELVNILNNLRGCAVLSGYKNEVYEGLRGYLRLDFKSECFATGRTKTANKATTDTTRVESVYLCPKAQKRLKMGRQLSLFDVAAVK
jgi:DNA adenine methylase